jgi:hypothetical protein
LDDFAGQKLLILIDLRVLLASFAGVLSEDHLSKLPFAQDVGGECVFPNDLERPI